MPCCRFQLNRRLSHFRVRFLKSKSLFSIPVFVLAPPKFDPAQEQGQFLGGVKPPELAAHPSCGQLKRPFPIVWRSNHSAAATKVRIYAPKRTGNARAPVHNSKAEHRCYPPPLVPPRKPARTSSGSRSPRKGRKIQRLERCSRSPELKFTSPKNAVLAITQDGNREDGPGRMKNKNPCDALAAENSGCLGPQAYLSRYIDSHRSMTVEPLFGKLDALIEKLDVMSSCLSRLTCYRYTRITLSLLVPAWG
jgi:hypothetical protein